ncbi:hypothetical protein D3P07_05395 [Paenibacillus sp. 1011MAR3C5]|uniref:hypothetical protein n=1 Tax=Paenibacillus sp. 1011MAR3C5 TaxID=1675787 RepID=UPI000E6C3C47|nr:hypothetical protein [Paenibacillus sp. 1011MAR3C5]RJE89674.1 hypothetical protein D3P07_05395 [Paenibacillus sp. 1011MAR3C5]
MTNTELNKTDLKYCTTFRVNRMLGISILYNESKMKEYLNQFFHFEQVDEVLNDTWIINCMNERYHQHLPVGITYEMELKEECQELIIENNTAVRPKETKGIIIINKKLKQVHIYNPDFRMLYIETYRVVRQILARELLKTSLMIHGSAVEVNGETFSFIGSKGRGKSTFITGLLHKEINSKYICNDRYFIQDDSTIIQWPECPAITYNTIALFPELIDRIEHYSSSPKAFNPSEIFIDHPTLPDQYQISLDSNKHKKAFFTNKEFSLLLNRAIKPVSRLDHTIFLSPGKYEECEIITLNQSMTKQHLIENLDKLSSFPDWLKLEGNVMQGERNFNHAPGYLFKRTFDFESDLNYFKQYFSL